MGGLKGFWAHGPWSQECGEPNTGRLEEPWLRGGREAGAGAGQGRGEKRDNAWNPRSQTPSGRQEEEVESNSTQ